MARSVDIIVKAHDKASKNLGKMEGRFGGFGKVLKGMAAGAAAYFGGRALLRGAKESLAAFGEQEQAVGKLHRALADLGVDADGQVADLQTYASGIQDMTTIGDEAVLQIAQLGASIGRLSGERLKQATTAAIGFSKAYGIDTKAAMVLVAKAAQGNTSALSRYGVQLDANLTSEEKFQEVLRRGKEAFGVAEAEADTYAGRMQQLKNAVGDVKERIGQGLAPVVKSLAEGFLKHKETITAFAVGAIEGFRSMLRGAVKAFTGVEAVALNWKTVLKGYVSGVGAAYLGLFLDLKHWFTVALPAYTSWFADNWYEVLESAVNAAWSIFENFSGNVVKIFKNLPALIKGQVDLADLWTPLLDGFEATFDALPEIAGRKMTETERKLWANVAAAGRSVADTYNENVTKRLAALGLGKAAGGAVGAGAPGGGAAGSAGAAAAATAGKYSAMKAFESRSATRAPGQDPWAKQHNLTKRMIAVLENVEKNTEATEKNTKPAGGGTWHATPVGA